MSPDISANPRRVVVIGAGHGGGFVVGFLRQYGFTGSITLVGDEPVLPYHRPPLSKAWIKGNVDMAGLALRLDTFYTEQHVDLRLGCRATAIDAVNRQVSLDSGEQFSYDDLILATGADARQLPLAGSAHNNVMTLRTVADAEKLRTALGPGKRLVIIGGGYVGLECAATARAIGSEVVLIERAPRLLERVASAPISGFLQTCHEQQGVQFVLDASIEAIEGENSAEAVRIADGRRFPCDVVLVGIGATPATALAETSELACDDGITIDADCRTSNQHIFALGDAAKRPHPLYQRNLRLESVPSAMEQAKRVASVIAGREPGHAEVPWFWSDQYELKLQIVGLPFEVDQIVVRGDPASGKFGVYHLSTGRVVTVEAINSPPDFFAGKKLLASGKVVDAGQLADTSIALTELAA